MSIFDEFDKAYDSKSMKEEVKEAAAKAKENGDFKDITPGTYQCFIKEMELKASKNNEPMVAMQLKITDGEFKNQIMFVYFMLTKPFLIHKCNEFLRSLETGIDVDFDNYGQYADVVADIFKYSEDHEMDLDVEMSLRDGKYKEYKVKGVYTN